MKTLMALVCEMLFTPAVNRSQSAQPRQPIVGHSWKLVKGGRRLEPAKSEEAKGERALFAKDEMARWMELEDLIDPWSGQEAHN